MPTTIKASRECEPGPGGEHRAGDESQHAHDDKTGAEHSAPAESPANHGRGGEGHADGPGQEQRRQRLACLPGIAAAHALDEERHVGLDPEEDPADQKVADHRGCDRRPDHQIHGQDRVFGVKFAEHEADQEHGRQSGQNETRSACPSSLRRAR